MSLASGGNFCVKIKVVRSAWVGMPTALVVCLNSASIAVWMVLSLSDASSNGEGELAMVVDENFI